jgi:hypothetical protein
MKTAWILFPLLFAALPALEQTNRLFSWPGDFEHEAKKCVDAHGGPSNAAFAPIYKKGIPTGEALVKAVFFPKMSIRTEKGEAIVTVTPRIGRKGDETVSLRTPLTEARELVEEELARLMPDEIWRSLVSEYVFGNEKRPSRIDFQSYLAKSSVLLKGTEVLVIRSVKPEILAPLAALKEKPNRPLSIKVEWKPQLGKNLGNYLQSAWMSQKTLGVAWTESRTNLASLLIQVDACREQPVSEEMAKLNFKSAMMVGSVKVLDGKGQVSTTSTFLRAGSALTVDSALERAITLLVQEKEPVVRKALSAQFEPMDRAFIEERLK